MISTIRYTNASIDLWQNDPLFWDQFQSPFIPYDTVLFASYQVLYNVTVRGTLVLM